MHIQLGEVSGGEKALNSLWRMLLPSGLGPPLAATGLAGKCFSLLERTDKGFFFLKSIHLLLAATR